MIFKNSKITSILIKNSLEKTFHLLFLRTIKLAKGFDFFVNVDKKKDDISFQNTMNAKRLITGVNTAASIEWEDTNASAKLVMSFILTEKGVKVRTYKFPVTNVS